MAAKQIKKANNAQQPKQAHATTAKKDSRMASIAAISIILVFTLLLYNKALHNGITFMDDDYYLLKNNLIRDFSWQGVKNIFSSFYSYNYHPLTLLTYMIEYRFFNLDPYPYHLVNVVLHLANTFLVFRITEKLSGKTVTASIVALLFAVHPMHVESVAWLSERKDVLYSFFYLSSLLCYLHYLQNKRPGYYIGVILLFTASLFSKSAAITLPLLLIAIDIYKGRKLNAKALLEKAPLLLLSILFSILAVLSQREGGALNDLSLTYSAVNRVFFPFSAISFYIIKLIAPFGLSALHFFPEAPNGILPLSFYLSLPFVIMLIWLTARRSSYRKEIMFGAAFFLITISVMLQVITVGSSFAAERYTYVPYIGLFYIIGQVAATFWNTKYKNAVAITVALFAGFCSVLTWSRIDVWKDTDALFSDVLEKTPGNWRIGFVYNSWGNSRDYIGDNTGALQYYTKAVTLYPGYERGFYNRGLEYDKSGDPTSALKDYNAAIALKPMARTYNARGWAFYETGNKQAAISDFNKALQLQPEFPDAFNNRGWLYFEMGNLKGALSDFNNAIRLAPAYSKPYYNRAAVKAQLHDYKGALEDYNYLVKLDPNDGLAYYNRGLTRYNLNDLNGANDDMHKAMDLGNKDAASLFRRDAK